MAQWRTETEVRDAMRHWVMDGASTCSVMWNAPTISEPKEEKRMVDVYQVFVINRETEELMSTTTVVGEGEADAMVGFPLDAEMKRLKRMDKLVILTQRVGDFEKFEIQEVRVRGDGSFEKVEE